MKNLAVLRGKGWRGIKERELPELPDLGDVGDLNDKSSFSGELRLWVKSSVNCFFIMLDVSKAVLVAGIDSERFILSQ